MRPGHVVVVIVEGSLAAVKDIMCKCLPLCIVSEFTLNLYDATLL